jgi:ribonuclease P/MRP protein subunit POP1
MASSTQQAGQKRKLGFDKSANSSNSRKKQKNHDARAIPVQRPDAAVSATGELNVSSFIKAREFEIGALEKSMQKARKNLSTRAFQQVPRHMRRRTASHNAKKVPRRLRKRAEREVGSGRCPALDAAY